ncbi:MAG TPA: SemiSWEET family transporter [Actinomycetota bacterium]|nr:SemiSWEET family transporter [Actinomycetota bacterium]
MVNVEWLAYAGSVLMTAMSLPQIARILRDRSAAGVSLLTWIIFALSGASWFAYGLLVQAPGIIVGNIPFLSTTLPVVMLLLVRQRNWSWLLAIAAPLAAAATVVMVLLQLPSSVSGGIGVACGLLTTVPQLIESLNRRRAGLPSEVSLATLGLLLTGQLLWLSYGIFRPDVPIILTNVVAVFVTVSLLVVEGGRSRRTADANTQ